MTTDAAADPVLRRVALGALAAITIVSGLAVHRLVEGIPGDVAGDALYAVMIYLLAAGAFPRAPRRWPALFAIVFCTVIELLQLTGLPRIWADVFPPAGLVFGAGFDARDLVVYTAAVFLAALIDLAVTRLLAYRRSEHDRGRPPAGERPLV